MNGPPLDTHQMRAFATVAETGSFTTAAQMLHLTQPAVSRAVANLEEDIGCRLFDRQGRKVHLTQAGEHLLKKSRQMLAEMDEIRQEIRGLGRWGHGKLRLGTSLTICQHLLPSVLREFKESFPRCTITIESGDTPETLESLHGGRIDMVLGLRPDSTAGLTFRPLFSDTLVFLVNPVHPWARRKQAPRQEVAAQNIIVHSQKSYTYGMVERHFAREGISLRSSVEIGSIEAIKELVKIGLGIGIMAPWVARKEIESGALVPVLPGPRPLRRQWGILLLKSHAPSLPEETFAGLCTEAARSLTDGPATGKIRRRRRPAEEA